MKQKPIFIINTGRCGSTFLSRIINEHPQFLVISELIEPIAHNPYFDNHRVDGNTFWDYLNRKSMQQRVDIWRKTKTRELGYLDENDENVSLLSAYTLPQLSEEHLELRNKIHDEVCAWSTESVSKHFINLMELIRDIFGKEIWIERTGGSINQVDRIVKVWPEAKFIYIFRNGYSTLKSMYRHPILSMFSYLNAGHRWDVAAPPNPVYIAQMWYDWMFKGLSVYSKTKNTQKLVVNYDHLLGAPEDEASGVLKFCRQDECLRNYDNRWLKWVSSQIRVNDENKGNGNYDDDLLYEEYQKHRSVLSEQFPELENML